MRLVAGFLFAPLACGLLALTYAVGSEVHEAVNFLEFSLLIGYASAIVLGIPAYLIMRYFGLNSLKPYLLVGFVLGLIPFEATWPGIVSLLWAWLSGKHPHWFVSWSFELPCGLAGTLSAFVFWLIVRPDHQCDTPP